MASFTLPLAVCQGVTVSLSLTSANADSAVALSQLATQISMAQDHIRQAVLDSVAPHQREPAPRTENQSAPVAPKAEPDTSPRPSQPGTPGTVPRPSQPGTPVHGRNGIDQYRLARARTAGHSAGQKLRFELGAVPATPELPEPAPPSRFYVVLRSSDDSPPAAYQSWKQCKRHVLAVDSTEVSAGAVFHAFGSWTEVQEYCQGAGVPEPARQ